MIFCTPRIRFWQHSRVFYVKNQKSFPVNSKKDKILFRTFVSSLSSSGFIESSSDGTAKSFSPKLRKIFGPRSRQLIQKHWIFVKDFYPRSVPLEKYNAVLTTVIRFFADARRHLLKNPITLFKIRNWWKSQLFLKLFLQYLLGTRKMRFPQLFRNFYRDKLISFRFNFKNEHQLYHIFRKNCTDELLLGIRRLMFSGTFWTNFAKIKIFCSYSEK